jgi:hypothetical protein
MDFLRLVVPLCMDTQIISYFEPIILFPTGLNPFSLNIFTEGEGMGQSNITTM